MQEGAAMQGVQQSIQIRIPRERMPLQGVLWIALPPMGRGPCGRS